MKVIVASTNPVKINAVSHGLAAMFPNEKFEVRGVSVPSGVSDQPKGNEETFKGALNRAENVSKHPEALDGDIWFGIEGGIDDRNGEMQVYAWVVAKSKDGKVGKGRTGAFILPSAVAEHIRQGKELSEADALVFGRQNSKHLNGTVGILTGDAIDRTNYYRAAVIYSLIPFKHKDLY